MNHVELHAQMSEILNDLVTGKIKPKFAKEYFNGAGKLLSNCKNELYAITLGAKIEVPLLGIKAEEMPLIESTKMNALPEIKKALNNISQ